MAKSDLQLKARKMRRGGESILSISRKLAVSKSSASIWCRDIELTDAQRTRLLTRKDGPAMAARLKGARMQYERRLQRMRDEEKWAVREFQNPTSRDLLLIGAALYWAEGSRKRSQFIFSNSDAAMINLILRYLQALGIEKSRLAPQVFINHQHKDRIGAVQRYWVRVTGLPQRQFLQPIFIKTRHKKRYENFHHHYGMLKLHVRKSSGIFYRTRGIIELLRKG